MGNVMTCHNVNDNNEETPLVDKAVYPPDEHSQYSRLTVFLFYKDRLTK